jgi:transposase
LHITVTAGHRHEMTAIDELMKHTQGRALIADAAYDADRVRKAVRAKRIKAVIHPGSGRKRKTRLDKTLYARRYLIECFFHHLKRFRAIATRYEKTARNYLALLNLACAWLWIN